MPFSKPVVYISDFIEAQDILLRRKEFDRSDYAIALLKPSAEHHHVNLKTGPQWKQQRRLLQDLMAPKFLHNVAAQNIYNSALRLVTLWKTKARAAAGQPFAAEKDIYYTALDAVLDFTFGDNFADRTMPSQIQAAMDATKRAASSASGSKGANSSFEFPTGSTTEVIEAILQGSKAVGEIANSGFITLAWWWKKLQPSEKQFRRIRHDFVKDQVFKSIKTLQRHNGTEKEDWVSSAIDLMLQRETMFAKKEGREPQLWSGIMHDEILGFVAAGHDTTSTALCWAVKFLTDNPTCQDTLRSNLRLYLSAAFKDKRPPTYQEILSTRIPYLEAVVEETLRLAITIPVVERQCTQDTVILGRTIPKGTYIFMPSYGPSFTEPAFNIDKQLRSQSALSALEKNGERSWPEDNMDSFQPERWLSKGDDGQSQFNSSAGPTLPFGLGKRGCFGQRLAYLEMKLVISLIVWSFEFQVCPEDLSSYEDYLGMTRMPKYCYIKLKETAF
ncbi:hypothetical protein FOBRF1_012100 [Fusarium oxysporum]